jgi:hypothetical protein
MTENHDPGTDPVGLVSGHHDPEGEAPWALQLVVQVEKTNPPTTTTVVEAAAIATVTLLGADEAGGPWADAITRWCDGRIRKLVRRARGAAWDKVQPLDGVTITHDGCAVRAFVPGPTDQVAPELRRLQVEGFTLCDPEVTTHGRSAQGLVIALTSEHELRAHPGKAAAQAAHAAQVAQRGLTTVERELWHGAGYPLRVIWPSARDFTQLATHTDVQIHDAGFTVVPSGTLTALAYWG